MGSFAVDPGALRSLLGHLEQSQWLSADAIHAAQFRQLRQLLAHAYETVPYYRLRFDDAQIGVKNFELDRWSDVPILTRQEVQLAGSLLHSVSPAGPHAVIGQSGSSGSTGRPILALSTAATQLFWSAFAIRDHLWHRRLLNGKLAAIRATNSARYRPPDGGIDDTWGPPLTGFMHTGPCAMLDIHSTTDEQAEWLQRQEPDYLLTNPTTARALAHHWGERRQPLRRLREIRTFGECLDSEIRAVCANAFHAPVIDVYTAGEVGYIALQCPETENYHIQAEGVYLEILDESGRACGPGAIGRVVITSLVNFAMPLIRYEIGDYAEWAPACPCGRGLPVMRRILGRERNMCLLPDGRRRWPSLSIEDSAEKIARFPPIQQFQLVQRTRQDIELLLVMHRSLQNDEEMLVRQWAKEALGHAFDLKITYVSQIERSPSGKFEDFRCEIPQVGLDAELQTSVGAMGHRDSKAE